MPKSYVIGMLNTDYMNNDFKWHNHVAHKNENLNHFVRQTKPYTYVLQHYTKQEIISNYKYSYKVSATRAIVSRILRWCSATFLPRPQRFEINNCCGFDDGRARHIYIFPSLETRADSRSHGISWRAASRTSTSFQVFLEPLLLLMVNVERERVASITATPH